MLHSRPCRALLSPITEIVSGGRSRGQPGGQRRLEIRAKIKLGRPDFSGRPRMSCGKASSVRGSSLVDEDIQQRLGVISVIVDGQDKRPVGYEKLATVVEVSRAVRVNRYCSAHGYGRLLTCVLAGSGNGVDSTRIGAIAGEVERPDLGAIGSFRVLSCAVRVAALNARCRELVLRFLVAPRSRWWRRSRCPRGRPQCHHRESLKSGKRWEGRCRAP